MNSNDLGRDYYVEFYALVDEILAAYIKVNELPAYVATVLFERSYNIKEEYNKDRSEGMSLLEGKEYLKERLIPNFQIERGDVVSDTIIPMPKILLSLGSRIAIYLYNNRQLKYLLPLIEEINRPLLLLCEQSVKFDIELPEYVQAIDLDYALAQRFVATENPLIKRLSTHFILLNSLLRALALEGVIVLEGCHLQEQMLAEIATSLGIPSIAIQQGWPSVMHTMFRRLPYTHFLTWGDAFNSLWGEYNHRPQYIATGYPYPVKAKLSDAISFFLQSPLFISNEDYYKQMIELAVATAERFPDRKIYVREHPEFRLSNDWLSKLRNIPNLKIVTDYSLNDVFACSEIIVSHFSSSLLEGIIHHCIPISFDPTTDSYYWPNLESIGIGYTVKNFTEFFERIAQILSRKDCYVESLSVQQKRFFKDYDKKALNNQIRDINKIAPIHNHNITFRKLNIGCGRNLMKGWLNADLFCGSSETFQMDGSKLFPFADSSFEYIFSEHMFEHLNLLGQQNFMSECYRTLSTNGVLRLAMPDFDFLINLVNNPEEEINKKYLEWSYERFVSKNVSFEVIPSDYPVYVVNNFMRDWGHRFIHNKQSLMQLGKSLGFKNVRVCKIEISEYAELCNCEKHQNEIPDWANNLETMVIEFYKS